MTGLKPEIDRIIEVALVVTDSDLATVAEAPVWVVHQDDAALDGMDSWNQGTHGRSGLIDEVKASTLVEADGRDGGARVPARARARQGVADVRQLDLPGSAVPRALDARARGLFPLPQSRRLDAEGARAALAARADEGRARRKASTRRSPTSTSRSRNSSYYREYLHSLVKFCSNCGAGALAFRIPDGDTLPRYVCAQCGTIHYQNPKIVVGCLPEWEGQVLLCKRAIEPRYGLWTLPAGFLENGETLAAGALRETLEEANARVAIDESVHHDQPAAHQPGLHDVSCARCGDLDFGPGTESLEVALFREEDIPWDQLAFRTIGRTLRNFFLDRKLGSFPVRLSAIDRRVPLKPDVAGAA